MLKRIRNLFRRKPSSKELRLQALETALDELRRDMKGRLLKSTASLNNDNIAADIKNVFEAARGGDMINAAGIDELNERLNRVQKRVNTHQHFDPQYACIATAAENNRIQIADIRASHGKTLYRCKEGLKNLFMWKTSQDDLNESMTSVMGDLVNRATNLETNMKMVDKYVGEQMSANAMVAERYDAVSTELRDVQARLGELEDV